MDETLKQKINQNFYPLSSVVTTELSGLVRMVECHELQAGGCRVKSTGWLPLNIVDLTQCSHWVRFSVKTATRQFTHVPSSK